MIDPLLAGLFPLGLGQPLDVVPAVAVAESLERRQRLPVYIQRGREVVRHLDFLLLARLRSGRLDTGLIQLHGFFDIAPEDLVGGKIGEVGQLDGSHCCVVTLLEDPLGILHQLALPEAEADMLFERSGAAQHSFVLVAGNPPLDLLLDIGARFVKQLTELGQSRLREFR